MVAGAVGGPAAGSAGAETICVHAPVGTACDGEQADLATALQAAQGTFEPTTIALGASQTGPFVYPDVTAVHRGLLDGHEIGLSFHPVDNGGRADLSSVVVAGYSHEIERDPSEGPSSLPMTIRDSVWDDANDLFVDVPNTGQVVQSGNVHADPGLVDLAGGDYRLRGSSAAVDRDSQTDPRYVAIDGLAPVGAAADAGAFEFRGEAPLVGGVDAPAPDPAPAQGATAPGTAKDLVAPKLTKVRLSKHHRKVLFTVSERAKVRVTVHGRTIVKTVAAGRRSIRLGRARHGVVKITATDLAGNRSAARRTRS